MCFSNTNATEFGQVMMLKLLSIPSTDRGCIVIPILGFYLFEYKLRANYEYMTLRDLLAKHACQTGVEPKFIRYSSNVEKQNDKKDKTKDYLIIVQHMNMFVSTTYNTCLTCFLYSLGQTSTV